MKLNNKKATPSSLALQYQYQYHRRAVRQFSIIVSLIILAGIGIFVVTTKSSTAPNTLGVATQQPSSCQNIIAETTVLMKDGSFEPKSLTVKKCTQVVFENKDSNSHWPASNLHPTHGIYPEFDPQKGVELGESWSFIFDKAGKWRYHDHLFPSIRGEVQVNE